MTPVHAQRAFLATGALAIAIAVPTGVASAASPSQALLKMQASVTQEAATATALARVPHATVKSRELEQENGRLVWSFDILPPGRGQVIEIWIDATTGAVVSLKKETPAQEAAEANADRRERKGTH
jgi:hypothetical protein